MKIDAVNDNNVLTSKASTIIVSYNVSLEIILHRDHNTEENYHLGALPIKQYMIN
jgi:hypothetical protein